MSNVLGEFHSTFFGTLRNNAGSWYWWCWWKYFDTSHICKVGWHSVCFNSSILSLPEYFMKFRYCFSEQREWFKIKHMLFIINVFIVLYNRCHVPEIQLSADSLNIGRCFLNYQYESAVELVNDTDLPAKYQLIDQVCFNHFFFFFLFFMYTCVFFILSGVLMYILNDISLMV